MSGPAFQTRWVLSSWRQTDDAADSNDAVPSHPLHVGVFREDAFKFFGRDAETLTCFEVERVAGEEEDKDDDTTKTSSHPLFCRVILINSLQVISSSIDSPLSISSSSLFLRRYDLHPSSLVRVRPVVTFPLARVSLITRSDAADAWLRAALRDGSFVGAVAGSRRPLARRGDPLLLPPEAFAEDAEFRFDFLLEVMVDSCVPIAQGHLIVDTLVESVRRVDDEEPKSESVVASTNAFISASTLLRPSPIFDHRLLASLVRRARPAISTPSTAFDVADDLHKVFVAPAVASRLLGSSSDSPGCRGWGLISGVASDDEESDAKRRFKLVNVVALQGIDPGEILASPLLLHNLVADPWRRLQRGDLISLRRPTVDMIDPLSSQTPSTRLSEVVPPFAHEVHVSPVAVPDAPTTSCFGRAFRRHFEKPRLVNQGDVICVSVGEDPDLFLSDGGGGGGGGGVYTKPWRFFKVTKVKSVVDGVGFSLVDSQRTTLIQAGTVNCPVPEEAAVFGHPDFAPLFDRLVGAEVSKNSNKKERKSRTSYLERRAAELKSVVAPILEDHDSSMEKDADDAAAVCVLVVGPKGVGKSAIVKKVAAECRLNLLTAHCLDLVAETLAAAEAKLKTLFLKRALDVAPCLLHLVGVDVLAKDAAGAAEPRVAAALRDVIVAARGEFRRQFPLVVVGTSDDESRLTPEVADVFVHRVVVSYPTTETDRRHTVDAVFCGVVDSAWVARHGSGMALGDVLATASSAQRRALDRISRELILDANDDDPVETFHSWRLKRDAVAAGVSLTHEDVAGAVEEVQSRRCRDAGAPRVPTTRWTDIGGFDEVKKRIRDALELPLTHPRLFAGEGGSTCGGVLLHGPPGTGKTLFAKAVATECGLNFLSVKGPELLNMYVGESEANVRRVFQSAREAAPCVVFFDEMDALAPNRGVAGDSAGVMDRVVSQLLAELDGLNVIDANKDSEVDDAGNREPARVFVIGATNRPDLLDPALLRPGRLETSIRLGPADNRDDLLEVFRAVSKNFVLDPDCSIDAVAAACPLGVTGAEVHAVCSEALTLALRRRVAALEASGVGDVEDEEEIVVSGNDFARALKMLRVGGDS